MLAVYVGCEAKGIGLASDVCGLYRGCLSEGVDFIGTNVLVVGGLDGVGAN